MARATSDQAISITKIKADNFLSLVGLDLQLESLNVLAGPNGSGKSNLLRVFEFLGAVASRDLGPALRQLGGIEALRFRNATNRTITISIEGVITKHVSLKARDEYTLRMSSARPSPSLRLQQEYVVRREEFKLKRLGGPGRRITLKGTELRRFDTSKNARIGAVESVTEQTSGLSLLRRMGEPQEVQQVEEMAALFESLRLFDVSVEAVKRPVTRADSDSLASDGSNIAAYLLRLMIEEPSAFQDIEEDVRAVLPSFEKFVIDDVGGGDSYLVLMVKERMFEKPMPLDRMSFGTIRAIVLFTMLNDPNPPRLTCIEEIDHGFHPQALDRLVDRLREATNRTQLILATHSPALINRLRPKELIGFSRNQETGATRAKKPSVQYVQRLQRKYGYQMGELWFAGLLEADGDAEASS